jgi:hypothetical protein
MVKLYLEVGDRGRQVGRGGPNNVYICVSKCKNEKINKK